MVMRGWSVTAHVLRYLEEQQGDGEGATAIGSLRAEKSVGSGE